MSYGASYGGAYGGYGRRPAYDGYRERNSSSYRPRGPREEPDGRATAGDIQPKYSKVFVLGDSRDSQSLADEPTLRNLFSDYGTIEDVYIKKDKNTGESKGIAFVKFSRASEAAEAIDKLHLKQIGGETLKVSLAKSEKEKDSDNLIPTRVFIMVPRSHEREDISKDFEQFGTIEHISLVKDKATGANKGLAYVSFYTFKDAALALEGCDSQYRAQWAESKAAMERKKVSRYEEQMRYGGSSYSGGGGMMGGGIGGALDVMSMMSSSNNPTKACRLKVKFSPEMSETTFHGLFNIVPGLVNCEFIGVYQGAAMCSVTYSNPQSAGHAMERITGFEYPPGFPMQLMFDGGAPSPSYNNGSGFGGAAGGEVPDNIKKLMENISEAAEVLKASGYGGLAGGGGMRPGERILGAGETDASKVSSAKLPPPCEILPANTKCEERLFFVLKEARDTPNPDIIKDLFCRFGNLIEAYCLRGKKCGYARYASKESANAAIAAIDGEDVLGSRIKVEIAEDVPQGNKRARRD
eukprot:TRINITY_DN7308_c0_g1_i3.p1 TRINITY_DN7308_c0_g1~~TRINITY_DN7308_c0_g1_i3.p1  ORF type:complete len:523 (-),score=160.34 TRINITY_DN7308_c0_g1_i3:305-1873(-)